MKRSYWMIALSLAILIIIGTVVTVFILSTPKAGAPSIAEDITETNLTEF